jgi:hypothetical protein
MTQEEWLAAVQRNGYNILYLTAEERTPEVCLAAVTNHSPAIQHLTDEQRTLEVCKRVTETYFL